MKGRIGLMKGRLVAGILNACVIYTYTFIHVFSFHNLHCVLSSL